MTADNEVLSTIDKARDVLTVKRVFGDPYEKNGVTMIPAARVQGAAGGGKGEGTDMEGGGAGSGSGSGFGMNARPAGAFVIKGDDVQWRPAVDVNKIIIGAQLIALAAILLARTVVKTRASHPHEEKVEEIVEV
jgi:uncharacterized spore protein YtfJ